MQSCLKKNEIYQLVDQELRNEIEELEKQSMTDIERRECWGEMERTIQKTWGRE